MRNNQKDLKQDVKKKQTYDSFGKSMSVRAKLDLLNRHGLRSFVDKKGVERIVRMVI